MKTSTTLEKEVDNCLFNLRIISDPNIVHDPDRIKEVWHATVLSLINARDKQLVRRRLGAVLCDKLHGQKFFSTLVETLKMRTGADQIIKLIEDIPGPAMARQHFRDLAAEMKNKLYHVSRPTNARRVYDGHAGYIAPHYRRAS